MTNNDEGNIRRERGVCRTRPKPGRSLVGMLVGVMLLAAGGCAAYSEVHEMELASSESDPVQEFVSEYYEAAATLVFENTYALLDDASKSRISEEDWVYAQNARYFEEDITSAPLSAEVIDSETLGETIVADLLVTNEDGSREEIAGFAMSINDSGEIRRSLTDEDIEYLMALVNEGGDSDFEVYRDCPDGSAAAQYDPDCDLATGVSIPSMEDVADDATRDTTTATGALGDPSGGETTSDYYPSIDDIAEDARRDTTTVMGAMNPEETTSVSSPVLADVAEDAEGDATATNESIVEGLMVEETVEASGSGEASPEDTSVEGAAFEEASVVGRIGPLAAVWGAAAVVVVVLLAGWFFRLSR